MPAIAPLVLKDGQTVPADHTFGVVTTNGSSAQFAERSSASPAGYYSLTHEVGRPATPSAAHRVKLGFNIPVMATVEGVPTVVRNSSAQVVFNCSTQSTEQERKDLLAYVANALADASVKSTVQNLEPFY